MQVNNTAMTIVQLWTLIVAAVAALGLGAIIGALITALTTSRRERGAWLREKQMDANLEYYGAVEAVHHLVLSSPDTVAMQAREDSAVLKSELDRTAHPQQMVNVADLGKRIAEKYAQVVQSVTDLQRLTRELGSKYQRLMNVGEPRTVEATRILSEVLPRLGSQAIALPGATGTLASQQRVAAERNRFVNWQSICCSRCVATWGFCVGENCAGASSFLRIGNSRRIVSKQRVQLIGRDLLRISANYSEFVHRQTRTISTRPRASFVT